MKGLDPLNAITSEITDWKPTSSGPLSGLRIGIKDLIHVRGQRTTAGSDVPLFGVQGSDAPIVRKLKEKGGEVRYKTNTHEFAMGATNTSSAFGPVRNPWDKERISGGSSGGSAAGVSLGEFDIGIGTDTGGSVRIPSALCGIIGLKPERGWFSMRGIVPFSRNLDTLGIMGKEIDLLERTYMSLSGRGERIKAVSDFRATFWMFNKDKISSLIMKKLEGTILGSKVVEVEEPDLERWRRARRIIASKEGADYHRTWFHRYEDLYFKDVHDIIESGLQVGDREYWEALGIMEESREYMDRVFSRVDVVISPTVRTLAPRISDVIGRERDFREVLVANTEVFNLSGDPSISIPIGRLEGLPVGLMISARRTEIVIGVASYILQVVST